MSAHLLALSIGPVQSFIAGYHAKLAEGDGPAHLLSDDYDRRLSEQLARLRGPSQPSAGAAGGAP